jgi:hypothetical protein
VKISEWVRIEDLMVEKYGWKKGIAKMVITKKMVTNKWLEEMSFDQDYKLRKLFKNMGLVPKEK